jgi:hypothetical protein
MKYSAMPLVTLHDAAEYIIKLPKVEREIAAPDPGPDAGRRARRQSDDAAYRDDEGAAPA